MTAPSTDSFSRTGYRAVCVALIVVHVFRVLQIAPRWLAGLPSAYPDQYERRLLGAIVGVGILSAALVAQSGVLSTKRGRVAYWGFLGTAVAVLIFQMITDR